MAELLESKLGDLKKREGAGFRLYDSDMGSDQAPASFTNLAAAAAAAPSPSSAVASAPVASAFGDTAKAVNPQAALEHKPPAQAPWVNAESAEHQKEASEAHCFPFKLFGVRSQVLSREEIKQIKAAAQKEKPVKIGKNAPAGNEPSNFEQDKFNGMLNIGVPAQAAYGLEHLMGVRASKEKMRTYLGRIAEEVLGIKEEVGEFAKIKTNDKKEDKDREEVEELLDYILNKEVSPKKYENGIRDKGRDEKYLKDFCNNAKFKEANLIEAELVAMRLYTTKAYKFINIPLRNNQGQCLLPVTTYFASSGIKKLRALNAPSALSERTLWRGIRDIIKVQDYFVRYGGTELAFMSTSSELSVAVRYGLGQENGTLLFKIISTDFMSTGADVKWFSAFPEEAEVLYPPLTYLKPTGRSQTVKVKRNGQPCLFTVMEVYPVMS